MQGKVRVTEQTIKQPLGENGMVYELGNKYCYIILDEKSYCEDTEFTDFNKAREKAWNNFLREIKPRAYEDIEETVYHFDDADLHRFIHKPQHRAPKNEWLVYKQARNIKLQNVQKYLKLLTEKYNVEKVKVEMNNQGLYCIWYMLEDN